MRDVATPAQTRDRAFLSHSSVDKPFVRLLADELIGLGCSVWLDELELQLGESLVDHISKAIAESAWLVACVSPHSIGSSWVTRELAMASDSAAVSRPIGVISVLFGELADEDIPSVVRDSLYVDCRKAEQYETALRRLRSRIAGDEQDAALIDFMNGMASQPFEFDAARARRFVAASAQPALRGWLVDYLAWAVLMQQDPTSRHFVYEALGSIGGEKSIELVRQGLSDASPWARQGAESAARRLGLHADWRMQ